MKITLNYTVKLGKYDNNEDVFTFEIPSVDKETENAYKTAVMLGADLEDVPELKALCDAAYKEIEREEINKLKDPENATEFALSCFAEGKSPFECGYRINVWLPEDGYVPDDADIEDALRKALSENDLKTAYTIALEQEENYSGDIIGTAFRLAEEVGCREFLEQNKKD